MGWAARRPLLLILLLALILRLLLLWSQPLHQLANDEVEYVTVARDLLAGRGWQFYQHYHWLRAPLYPLFLAGSLWLAGGDPAPGVSSISLGFAQSLHLAALPNILAQRCDGLPELSAGAGAVWAEHRSPAAGGAVYRSVMDVRNVCRPVYVRGAVHLSVHGWVTLPGRSKGARPARDLAGDRRGRFFRPGNAHALDHAAVLAGGCALAAEPTKDE